MRCLSILTLAAVLAAGGLGGEEAPPAPLQPGLVQQLAWDGTDDDGRQVSAGGLRVRGRAGMGVQLDRSGSWGEATAIPLSWPGAVDATERFIYVADHANVGALRLKKTWVVEESVPAR